MAKKRPDIKNFTDPDTGEVYWDDFERAEEAFDEADEIQWEQMRELERGVDDEDED